MSAAVAERRQPLTDKQIATIMRLRPAERDPERFAELRARAMNDRTDDARYRRGYRAGGKWTHFNKKGLLDKYSLAELISARVAFPRGAQAYLVKLACAVDRYGHSGLQVPHGRVASWIGVSPRQVAIMLDWLEAHGLVERLHDVEIHPEGFTDRDGRLRPRAELPVLVLPGPVLDAMIRRAKLHRAGRRIRVVVDARSSVAVLGSQTLRSDSVASSQSGLSDQTSKKACCYTLIHSPDLKALALDPKFLVRPESTLEFWHRIFVANRTATQNKKERARKRARITEQERPEDARRLTRRVGLGAQRTKRPATATRSASGRRSADREGLEEGATYPQASEPATSPADFAVGACRTLLDDLLNDRKPPETVVEGLRFVGDAAPTVTESYEADDPLSFGGDGGGDVAPPPPPVDMSTSTATGAVTRFDFVGLVNDLRDGRGSSSSRFERGDPPRLEQLPYDDDDFLDEERVERAERHHAEFRAWADEKIERSRRELAEYVAREQRQREATSRVLTPAWGPRPHSAPCGCSACVAWARAVVAAPSPAPSPVGGSPPPDRTAAD